MKMMNVAAASLMACLTLSAVSCAHDQPGSGGRKDRVASLGKITVLGWTQAARLPDGSRLQYINVTNDSRCPRKVVCVHAGWADANFRFIPANGPPSDFTMRIPRETVRRVGNYTMRIESLEQIGPHASTPPAIVVFTPAR